MEDPQQKCCWNLEDAEQPWDVEVFPALWKFWQGNTAGQNAQRPSSQPGSSPGTEPKVRLWRLLGQETPSRLQGSGFLAVTKIQVPQVAWQSHMFVWLWSNMIKHQTKSQTLQGAWQSHALKALVKKIAKCQALQIGGQGHAFKRQNRKVFNSLAFGGVQDSGSTSHRELNLPDCPAASRGRDSDWTSNQGQDIAACLGRSLGQGSDQRNPQKSSLSDRFDDRSRVRLTLIKPVVKS